MSITELRYRRGFRSKAVANAAPMLKIYLPCPFHLTSPLENIQMRHFFQSATRCVAKLRRLTIVLLLILTAGATNAHELFWHPSTFFLAPNSSVRIPLFNGTPSESEAIFAWPRIDDLSVVSPDGRATMDSAKWDTLTDKSTSWLSYTTGKPGTYVVGLSSKLGATRLLEAKDFNQHLVDYGLPDMLAERGKDGSLKSAARYRLNKQAKAIFQVGTAHSDGWATTLGYPAELVPLENPYKLKPGATLGFKCLVDGKPVANQLVEIGGGAPTTEKRIPVTARCDQDGVVKVTLDRAGFWYVKFIHMARVNDGKVDYESKWATITFEVR